MAAAVGSSASATQYDVFLSFRGPDTRNNFTDCLYRDMVGQGIVAYRDSEELHAGDRIDDLLRAVGESKICLPIFYKVCASSASCVRERARVTELDEATREAIEHDLKQVVLKLSGNNRPLGSKFLSWEVGQTSGVDDKSVRRRITSWQKGEMLGRGSFGDVYKGFSDGGFFFAVKEVSLLDQGSRGKESLLHTEQEISILSQLQHENIVQYYGTKKDDEKLYIFLELMTEGSLETLYNKYALSDVQVSGYTKHILNGLKYLHDQGVVHRDIKCANILVDARGSVKLADFGLAKVVNLKSKSYGVAADIWSLGCTVLEMLTRQYPYSHLEVLPALYKIGQGELPLVPNFLSRDARDFILRCLQVDPNKRPSAAELLGHPFVRNASSGFALAHFNNVQS